MKELERVTVAVTDEDVARVLKHLANVILLVLGILKDLAAKL